MSDLVMSSSPTAVSEQDAERYTAAAKRWWTFASVTTADLLGLAPGGKVLDVGCGPGALTREAAERVGASGWVTGVDISSRMLEAALRESAGIENANFQLADFHALPWRPASFDGVGSVFALFFADDLHAVVARMWDMVRPGGRIVLTTLGRGYFAPVYDEYVRAVEAEGVDVQRLARWTRTEEPAVLVDALHAAGARGVRVLRERGTIALTSIDVWREVVRATGIRRIHDELDVDAASRVGARVADWVATQGVTELGLEAVYAVAAKPRAGAGR